MAVGFEGDAVELSKVFSGQGAVIRVPVRHVLDAAELEKGNPVDHYPLIGSGFPVALNASYDAFHCCFFPKHFLQAAWAVAAPVVSLDGPPVAVDHSLRTGGNVSDVGNLPRPRPRLALHEGDDETRAKIQSIALGGIRVKIRSSPHRQLG